MKKQLLKRTEVEEVTSLSRLTIYAAMDIGDFPHPVKVGKRAADDGRPAGVTWPAPSKLSARSRVDPTDIAANATA